MVEFIIWKNKNVSNISSGLDWFGTAFNQCLQRQSFKKWCFTNTKSISLFLKLADFVQKKTLSIEESCSTEYHQNKTEEIRTCKACPSKFEIVKKNLVQNIEDNVDKKAWSL